MATEGKPPAAPEQDDLGSYTPRTELGAKLLELRRRVVSSGAPLLDWDDLEREIAERRGR